MDPEKKQLRLTRRHFVYGGAAVLTTAVAAPLLAGCKPEATPTAVVKEATKAPTSEPVATSAPAPEVSDFGVPYPEDAAAKEYQFVLRLGDAAGASGWLSMDMAESIYARAPLADFFSEPLVHLDNELNLVPGAAESWEVAEDGLTWTFRIRPGLMWSDGIEVTAEDWIASYRYMADPEHAYDFMWYWQGTIKNFAECAKGEVPLEELGVRQGATKHDLVFETYEPVPYLPSMLVYSPPLSAAGLKQYGSGVFNTNPDTCIACGPWKLEEWSPDRRFVIGPNDKYTGTLKPLINRFVATVVSGGDNILRFQAGEVDQIDIGTADVKRVTSDPNLSKLLKTSTGDFRTFYAFFDTTAAPYDDLRVRQAFAKAVDRESIVESLLAPLAMSAYSFLMPGFPDANRDGLKSIQEYDPEGAKKLLAEAGFPEGKNFPKCTLIVRGANPDPIPQAVAASISQTLGIPIEVAYRADKEWTAELLERPSKVPFGYVSYGMDYLDATNMLGVWLTGGRHTWSNADFDKYVKEGGRITSDMAERSRQMQEAERLLVESCAGIFVYHALQGQLHQPYRKGDHMLPTKAGYDGIQRQQEEGTFGLGFNYLYMGKEVVDIRKYKI